MYNTSIVLQLVHYIRVKFNKVINRSFCVMKLRSYTQSATTTSPSFLTCVLVAIRIYLCAQILLRRICNFDLDYTTVMASPMDFVFNI